MKSFYFLSIIVACLLGKEIHIIDLGFNLRIRNNTYVLVTENTLKLNVMQPFLMDVSEEDKNSAGFMGILTEIRLLFQHSGMFGYMNNITSQEFSCDDIGWSGNCPQRGTSGYNWDPLYYCKF